MSITPPPRPPAKAGQKANAAYYSELRRWAQRLAAWEHDLQEREDILNEREEEMNDSIDEEDCECGPQDALDGCGCPTCTAWRYNNPAAMRVHGGDGRAQIITERRPLPESLKPVGDEVDFLNKLFLLKDKRRKK